MNMMYVRGANNWATPVWEKPVEVEVAQWTRTMLAKTAKMRTHKDSVSLMMTKRLRQRLGLTSPDVVLTVNGSVQLSSVECSKPLCILDV